MPSNTCNKDRIGWRGKHVGIRASFEKGLRGVQVGITIRLQHALWASDGEDGQSKSQQGGQEDHYKYPHLLSFCLIHKSP
jgi:hypothetical protein